MSHGGRIGIAEDDFLVGQELELLTEECGHQVLFNVQNSPDLWKEIKNQEIDLLLMDIDLGEEMDGIELATEIRRYYDFPILFISGKDDRNTQNRAQAISPGSFNYLIKPVRKADLRNLIGFSLSPQSNASPLNSLKSESIFVFNHGIKQRIKYQDILYLKAAGSYTEIKLKSQKPPISVSRNLKKLSQVLPTQFFRISRSTIINLEHLEGFGHETILLNGETFDIGKTFREDFKKLTEHL